MSGQKTIKWGIMGCGKIAHKFAEDLLKIPDAKLYAVASRNLKKAKGFGKTYNAYTCYGSYEELVKNPEIDVVYIATPHVLHYENSMLCLEHNKAVLCEKPFAMNLQQVENMISFAQEKNLFLMEALWTYFLPHYQYVLQFIENKTLGEIKSLSADFGFLAPYDINGRLFNKKLGGGSLLDIGIYPLFAALSTLGYPENIEAHATFGETNVDETCTMKLVYPNNINANLYSSIIEETNTEANIEFEKGAIKLHGRFHEPNKISITQDGTTTLKTFDTDFNGYGFEAAHVGEMLRQDKTESTIMTFNMSKKLIKLLDTVREKIDLYYD